MEKMTFTARVQRLNRIAIPQTICRAQNIGYGDLVEVDIRKIKKSREGVFTPRE